MENGESSRQPISPVRIGNKLVGPGHPSYIVAEIGINHNGDIDIARRLISVAVAAGCDGLLLEVHPDPTSALSDGDQSITPAVFAKIMEDCHKVAAALGRPF